MGNSLLKDLNEEQRQVVLHGEGPALVLAGAGSGKTRCIAHRVAYLIKERQVNPDRILMCTFTNKASKEMKERVERLTGVSPSYSGTFHSLCARVLRKDGRHIKLSSNFVIYDDGDQVDLVKQAMSNIDVSVRDYKPRSILKTISEAKNELISALEYPQYARGAWQTTAARVYLEYQRLLLDAEALDFDDLLMRAVILFRKNKDVLSRYQDLWQHVLVDEYQDTNQAQFVLTKMLAGRWRNFCCVGDFSQSIYKWRGADFRNLERLKKEYPDIKTFRLERNYRSTQNILDAADAVINKNDSHPVLKLWTDKKGGESIGLFEGRDEKEEAEFIVSRILENRSSDIAVLYRTNSQSRVIEEVLLANGIAYILVGGVRFYQRREIKDLVSYLRVVSNPKDSVSMKRIVKIGKRRYEKFKALKDDKSQLAGFSTNELLENILKVTGYLDKFDKEDEEDLSRLENIKELGSVAAEFPDLNQFLENVALVEKVQEEKRNSTIEAGKKTVSLMTYHAAKGLEFDIVFMTGMEEGLFPHSRSMLNKEELEEERRLCYVGITRAKIKLYLTFTRRRMYFGSRNSAMVSRFVGEVPEHLLKYHLA